MCRPIAWVSHFISALGAINWGLVKFFQFNFVDYVTMMAKVPYLNELAYALIMICGIFSILSLVTPSVCPTK